MRRDWTDAKRKVEAEGVCRNCHSGSTLEPAHLIHRGMGGGMEAENIIPLCRTCHKAFDSHMLDILSLLTLEEQLAAVRNAGGIENARIRLVPSLYRRSGTTSS